MKGFSICKGSEVGKSPECVKNQKEANTPRGSVSNGENEGEEAGQPGRGKTKQGCGPQKKPNGTCRPNSPQALSMGLLLFPSHPGPQPFCQHPRILSHQGLWICCSFCLKLIHDIQMTHTFMVYKSWFRKLLTLFQIVPFHTHLSPEHSLPPNIHRFFFFFF